MSDDIRFDLPQSAIPRQWYNVQADLPRPLPPVLHPGTHQPVGPADLAPLFPMQLIMQEDQPGPLDRYSGRSARDLQTLAAHAPDARAPAGKSAGYAGPYLLQIRGRFAFRQPQAQHRDSASLVQQAGGHQRADHRNRRRAMGHRAGASLQLL